jgi:hypothetical protein
MKTQRILQIEVERMFPELGMYYDPAYSRLSQTRVKLTVHAQSKFIPISINSQPSIIDHPSFTPRDPKISNPTLARIASS